jgi:hypothetical protein
MGETLAETRLEVQRQRAELQATADRLRERARRTFDLKAKLRENPALFIGLGAGAVFLAAGGPVRAARLLRRRIRPTATERAYDSLPKPLQSWVDSLAGTVGPKAEQARQSLSEELVRWRHEPLRDKKARKELAKAMVEGPPGPGRTGWKAFEAAAAILSAALARKAVERFLSGEPPVGLHPALDATGTAGGAAKPDPDKAAQDVTRPSEERAAYASTSDR